MATQMQLEVILAKLNEKKNKGDIFSLEEQHENFEAAVTK